MRKILLSVLMLLGACTPPPTPPRVASTPVQSAAPTREAVVAYARRYVELTWVARPDNVFHGVDRDGTRVDTAEDGYVRRGGWKVGENVGVAYSWGGFDTPEQFLGKVSRDVPAGHVQRSRDSRGSRYTAGIDCSGLVSRSWGLPRKYSTRELTDVSVRIDDPTSMLPGDILNKANGHALIFEAFTDETHSRATFIEAGAWDGRAWRVVESQYSLDALLRDGFIPLRDRRRPASIAITPPPSCVIEGDGEPLDSLFFHRVPELAISATRGGPALVRTQGEARYSLHGRWSEIAAPAGGGRAHLELAKPGLFRISGYADLSAVRFRLRKEAAVVPEHVFLQVDSLVRVVGAERGEVNVVYEGPFETPKELASKVHCEDLGYEAVTGKYVDVPEGATDSVAKVRLYDAPGAALRFEGDAGLIFVRTLEERDGFARIDGARNRVRITGWTPRELVDHTPQGSGYGAGSRSAHTSRPRGRLAKITRKTPLLGRLPEGGTSPLGELEAGASVVVIGEAASELVTIAIDDLIAVDGAALLARAADIETP